MTGLIKKSSNVTLINAKVSGDGFVGTLIGETTTNHVTVSGCKVYLENYTVPATIAPYINSNGSVAGGLIGSAGSDVTISKSSASTVVRGGTSTGGLVGNVASTATLSIGQSYAASYLSGGSSIGGLVAGDQGTVTVDNSYAAGIIDVTGSGDVAGIMPRNSGRVENSYAAVRYVRDAVATATIYGVAQTGTTMTNNAFYVKQTSITYALDSGTGESMSTLKGKIGTVPFDGPDWYVPDAGATVNPHGLTVPYNILAEGLADPYPYPMLASDITAVDPTGGSTVELPMPHYGDWLEGSGYATSFYWENEKDSAGADHYHFYLVMSDDTAKYVADGLCTDHHLTDNMGQDVDDWGYGLIGIDETAVNTAGLGGLIQTDATVTDPVKSALETFLASPATIPWTGTSPSADMLQDVKDLFAADEVILLKGAEENKFGAIETGSGWLELNLGFAAAIDINESERTETTTAMGKASAPYQIRTVRQLDNIPNGTSQYYPHTGYYVQTHDLNGTDYASTYVGSEHFGGNYNGGSYRILELDMTNGLFTSIGKSTLSGIILYSPTGEAKITSSNNAGGLASTVEDCDTTIRNCIVAGYDMTGTNVGGLVGRADFYNTVNLYITNCAAVNTVNGNQAGGLVGRVERGNVYISNSYAGDSVGNSSSTYAGGIVGYAYNGTGRNVNYTNVYSYAKISGSNVYGIGDNGGSGSYTNCRYWNNGIPSEKTAGDESNATGVSLAEFENNVDPAKKVEHTYKPDTTDFDKGLEDLNNRTAPAVNDPYPFEAVVNVPATAYDSAASSTATVPVHYGAWPVIEVSAAYVELYPTTLGLSSAYGVYGYFSDSNEPINTLLDPAGVPAGTLAYAEDDGYGFLVPHGDVCPGEINVEGGKLVPQDSGSTEHIEEIYEDSAGNKYDFYGYKFEPDSGVTPANYYHSITLNGHEFWFNFDYGCEIVKAPTGIDVKIAEPQAKPGAAGEGTTASEYDGKVVIRTPRQLVKMADATGSTASGDGNAAQLRDYEQLLDINFEDSAYDYSPASLWRRKDNSDTVTASGSYDGHGFKICNLTISGNGLFATLGTSYLLDSFGNISGANDGLVRNITLVDVKVTGSDNVGALVGNVTNSTAIDNCGVYVSADNAANYDKYVVEGDANVGGLIGQVGGSTYVTNSYAAVKVVGESAVGGFAGQINGSRQMENCYSGGHLEDDGAYALDSSDQANVTVTDGPAGGFVGKLMNYQNNSSGNPNKSNYFNLGGVLYSTCSVLGKDKDNVGVFAGMISDWTEITDGAKTHTTDKGTPMGPVLNETATIYGIGSTFVTGETDEVKPREETYIKNYSVGENSIVVEAGERTTVEPYDGTLESVEYPYKLAVGEHHGDWLPPFQAAGIAYYENDDGEVKLQIVGLMDENKLDMIDTIDHDGISSSSIETGYVEFWTTETDYNSSNDIIGSSSYSDYVDTENEEVAAAISKALMDKHSGNVPLDYPTVKVYDTKEVAGASAPAVTVNYGETATVYYTVGYAGVAYDDQGEFGTETNPFLIRSVRQLDNIPNNVGTDAYFRLDRGIEGGGYEPENTVSSADAYYGAENFAGKFDGRGYQIQDLTSSNTAANWTGLFKSLSEGAEISNVVLYANGLGICEADKLTVTTNNLVIGGIANMAGGTAGNPVKLTNCAVVGYDAKLDFLDDTVTFFYYGGLIGQVESGGDVSITNCAAINDATLAFGSTRSNDVSYYHGGLVGNIVGNLALTNCYTGGSDEIDGTTGVTSVHIAADSGVFGLTGQKSGTVTANNCYSWVLNSFKDPTVAQLATEEFDTGSGNNYYIYNTTVGERFGDLKEYTNFLADDSGTLFPSTAADDFGEAANSYVVTDDLKYDDFPFPEVIREVQGTDAFGTANGDFVHYGDWPAAATSGDFGFFFLYSNQTGSYNDSAYALAKMFDKSGESTYTESQKGQEGTYLTIYCGFTIRKANSSKLDKITEIKNNLNVEFYRNEADTKAAYTIRFDDVKDFDGTLKNADQFAGYDLYVHTTGFKVDELNELTTGDSLIVVKYGSQELARFNWEDFGGTGTEGSTTSGDPTAPEGPSFEGAMAPAPAEAILPEKFRLVEE